MHTSQFYKVVDIFICCSCGELLYEPVSLPCGSLVCKRCLNISCRKHTSSYHQDIHNEADEELTTVTTLVDSSGRKAPSLGPSDSVSVISEQSFASEVFGFPLQKPKEEMTELDLCVATVGAYKCPSKNCSLVHSSRNEETHQLAKKVLSKLFPTEQEALRMVSNGESKLQDYWKLHQDALTQHSSSESGSHSGLSSRSGGKKSSRSGSRKSSKSSKLNHSTNKSRQMDYLSEILIESISPSLELASSLQLPYLIRSSILAEMKYFKEGLVDAKKATELNPLNKRGEQCEKMIAVLKADDEKQEIAKMKYTRHSVKSGFQNLISQFSQRCPNWTAVSSTLKNTLPSLVLEDIGCMLCQDPFGDPVSTPCGHSFCRNCLLGAMEYSRACPVCTVELPGVSYLVTVKADKFLVSILEIIFQVPTGNMMGAVDIFESKWTPVIEGKLVYPGSKILLDVTEIKYRALIKRALDTNGIFAIMLPSSSHMNKIIDHGVIVKIITFEEQQTQDTAAGLPRYLVSAQGLHRFRFQEKRLRNDGYEEVLAERVEDIEFDSSDWDPKGIEHLLLKSRSLVKAMFMSVTASARSQFEQQHGRMPESPAKLSFWLAAFLPMNSYTMYELLVTIRVEERLNLICHWMQIATSQQIQKQQSNFVMEQVDYEMDF